MPNLDKDGNRLSAVDLGAVSKPTLNKLATVCIEAFDWKKLPVLSNAKGNPYKTSGANTTSIVVGDARYNVTVTINRTNDKGSAKQLTMGEFKAVAKALKNKQAVGKDLMDRFRHFATAAGIPIPEESSTGDNAPPDTEDEGLDLESLPTEDAEVIG